MSIDVMGIVVSTTVAAASWSPQLSQASAGAVKTWCTPTSAGAWNASCVVSGAAPCSSVERKKKTEKVLLRYCLHPK